MGGIYIWGTGCGAGELAEKLPAGLEIAGYVDSFPLSDSFLGRPVLRPEALPGCDPALVIVSARQAGEILQRCEALGLSRERLFFVKNSVRMEDLNAASRARAILGDAAVDALCGRHHAVREPLHGAERPLAARDYENDYVRVKTLELCCRRLEAVPGDVAELGVYKGGFARCINALLPERTLWLFDTFAGFSPEEAAREQALGRAGAGFVAAHENTAVERVLALLPHPERAVVRQGLFPASLGDLEARFALVSLDADLEESTLAGLRWFVPRMNPGGYLFLHDWDSPNLAGVRAALARYEAELGRRLPALPLPDVNGSLILCF